MASVCTLWPARPGWGMAVGPTGIGGPGHGSASFHVAGGGGWGGHPAQVIGGSALFQSFWNIATYLLMDL